MSEASTPVPNPPLANLPEYSVSELSAAIKRTVEDGFALVRVRGEVSGLKAAASGHIYFDLKDEKAVLNAIIWKPTARLLKIRPEPGLEVICTGRLTTYPGSSRYQVIVEQMELAGAGALMAMLEERRKRLAAEGLFDAARKKPLPFLPEVIGVITSPTGAVLRDIMHRLNARFPRNVLLWPVAVQGANAAAEVAAAIAGFNAGGAFPRPDLIIVARGGGSAEDLMAFNEEAVVRAAFASVIPLISAVGHETDTTLLDFAADMRAPTPTAAAEMAVPVRAEMVGQVQDYERRVRGSFDKMLEQRRRHLGQLARILPRAEQLFAAPRQRLDAAGERLGVGLRRNFDLHRARFLKDAALLRPRTLTHRIALGRERLAALQSRAARVRSLRLMDARARLTGLARMLDSVSHHAVLARGFALVKGEDGKVRRRADAVKPGENLTLVFGDGETGAVAGGKKPTKAKKPGSDQDSLF